MNDTYIPKTVLVGKEHPYKAELEQERLKREWKAKQLTSDQKREKIVGYLKETPGLTAIMLASKLSADEGMVRIYLRQLKKDRRVHSEKVFRKVPRVGTRRTDIVARLHWYEGSAP